MKTMKCMKCGGEMQVGFILESTEGGRDVEKWIEGTPERPWRVFGVKIKNKEQYPIQTFRCVKCGYLESYAGAE